MTKLTKIALDEHRSPSAVAKDRAHTLTSQWYRDAEGILVIRWAVGPEPDERPLPAALAA
jgi:hypothetical protein